MIRNFVSEFRGGIDIDLSNLSSSYLHTMLIMPHNSSLHDQICCELVVYYLKIIVQ